MRFSFQAQPELWVHDTAVRDSRKRPMRTLIAAITILHLGPGLAFVLLAFGCDADAPLLGGFCGKDFITSFGAITALAWLALAAGYATWRRREKV